MAIYKGRQVRLAEVTVKYKWGGWNRHTPPHTHGHTGYNDTNYTECNALHIKHTL